MVLYFVLILNKDIEIKIIFGHFFNNKRYTLGDFCLQQYYFLSLKVCVKIEIPNYLCTVASKDVWTLGWISGLNGQWFSKIPMDLIFITPYLNFKGVQPCIWDFEKFILSVFINKTLDRFFIKVIYYIPAHKLHAVFFIRTREIEFSLRCS